MKHSLTTRKAHQGPCLCDDCGKHMGWKGIDWCITNNGYLLCSSCMLTWSGITGFTRTRERKSRLSENYPQQHKGAVSATTGTYNGRFSLQILQWQLRERQWNHVAGDQHPQSKNHRLRLSGLLLTSCRQCDHSLSVLRQYLVAERFKVGQGPLGGHSLFPLQGGLYGGCDSNRSFQLPMTKYSHEVR